MHRLRNRLILAFLVASVLPLGATIGLSLSLLGRSLDLASTDELDRVSQALEGAARAFYQRERESLQTAVHEGRVPAVVYGIARAADWPAAVAEFWASDEPERFVLSGPDGDILEYFRRTDGGVQAYRRELGEIRMSELSNVVREARQLVGERQGRDLRRGFTLTLWVVVGVIWLASLVPIVFIAQRVSRPIRQLTAGLTGFAAGDWDRRLATTRDDEVGRAVEAFNRMADQLQQSRQRLVYLTQVSSWQSLARKTAHELKNSLTPIRLTVEEMLDRQPPSDREFMAEAVRIVVDEIETLERRVRAFSELASEPPVRPEPVDVNALVAERVALLQPAHPELAYELALDESRPSAYASADLVKGILTNLMENAAEAAGSGRVAISTGRQDDQVVIEVHDSGPGVSAQAAATLFEPTITFKKRGMGLGLSIARKNALLSGGDITLVEGRLAGAGFRVILPGSRAAQASAATRGSRT